MAEVKRIILVPDLQVPLHAPRAVNTLATFIKATKPDTVVSVGDECDFTGISRWAQGTSLEHTVDIGKERDETVRVLELLKVSHVIRSNHTDRLYNSIMLRHPGLLGAPELQLENFLRFPQLGITYHRKPYELAPGWLLAHGDEGSMNQTAGMTALGLAKKWGMNVVCGHTHRAGVLHYTQSVNTERGLKNTTVWGMEVGNLMDQRKASYLKAGSANWQQAFGYLDVDGKHVTPVLVPIRSDGSFTVDGKNWGGK